jgi:hypothetical protein
MAGEWIKEGQGFGRRRNHHWLFWWFFAFLGQFVMPAGMGVRLGPNVRVRRSIAQVTHRLLLALAFGIQQSIVLQFTI